MTLGEFIENLQLFDFEELKDCQVALQLESDTTSIQMEEVASIEVEDAGNGKARIKIF